VRYIKTFYLCAVCAFEGHVLTEMTPERLFSPAIILSVVLLMLGISCFAKKELK
jgi:hypothetical protein